MHGTSTIIATVHGVSRAHSHSSCVLHVWRRYFDRLLLLAPGGRTSYHGDVSDIKQYFESHGGRKCGEHENIAEYAVEIVGRPTKDGKTWPDIWSESEERKQLLQKVKDIVEERKTKPDETDPTLMREYAAPLSQQTFHLTRRVARNFWRDASYGYGKIFTVVIVAICQ